MKLSRRSLCKQFICLTELGNRFAPTLAADIKVSKLLSAVAKEWEPIAIERAKIGTFAIRNALEMHGVKSLEELPESLQQLTIGEAKVAQDAWDAEEIEVTLPDTRITQNDLPKEKSGENGWQNGNGLAALVAGLGELFEYPKD